MRETLEYSIDLVSFTRLCHLEADTVTYLVDTGVLEPAGAARAEWRFSAEAVARGRLAARLMHDLEVEPASIGLIIELLEERDALRRRLAILQSVLDDNDR